MITNGNKTRSPSEILDSLAEQGLSAEEELLHDIFVGGTGFTRTDADGTVTRIDPKDFYSTYEAQTEWRAQEEIIALVRIFGREIAREKVANMLLIAFKETGR